MSNSYLFLINANFILINAHLVQRPPNVNGSVLNDIVHHLRYGNCEIRIRELWVEEYLGTQKPFITNVNLERLKKRRGREGEKE